MEKVNVQNQASIGWKPIVCQDLLHNPMAERTNVGLLCHRATSNSNKRNWLWSQGQMEWDPNVKVLWWLLKDLKSGFAAWVGWGDYKREEEQVHGELVWRNLQRCGGTQSGRNTDTSTLQILVEWGWMDFLSVTKQWCKASAGEPCWAFYQHPLVCATAQGTQGKSAPFLWCQWMLWVC